MVFSSLGILAIFVSFFCAWSDTLVFIYDCCFCCYCVVVAISYAFISRFVDCTIVHFPFALQQFEVSNGALQSQEQSVKSRVNLGFA